MVLEDMPQCDQEELYAQFGTAINILDFTCDETISEYEARENNCVLLHSYTSILYVHETCCTQILHECTLKPNVSQLDPRK